MARLLIAPSALDELRAVEPLARRQHVCLCLSEIEHPPASHRLSGGGCCRLVTAGLRVLYRERQDGTLIVTRIA
jgi:hypothetical protein